MIRDALVVGINTYDDESLRSLTVPAADAEAIAQLLEQYGEFHVSRLPAVKDKENNTIRVGQKTKVTLTQLQKAIVQLFKPEGKNIPDTALLYFSGHGLRINSGITESFLATSDVNPDLDRWGLSLSWLRQLLQESEVRQQIIWLDCSYSGELLNLAEADPGGWGKGRDRCFIAASREFEVAYEAIGSNHSLLTEALLEALNPSLSYKWVTNYTLTDHVNKIMRKGFQRPIFSNSGEPINLIRGIGVQTEQEETLPKATEEFNPLTKTEPTLKPTSLSIGSLRGAGNDLVSDRDQLGFNYYVKAFADLIESPYTKPPLTIGIFGSWGMGKSFLLDHITRELEQRSQEYKLANLLTAVINKKDLFGNPKLTELVTHIISSNNLRTLRDSVLLSIVMLEKLQAVTIQNLKVSDFLKGKQKLRIKKGVLFLPCLGHRSEEIALSPTSNLLLSSYLVEREKIQKIDEQNHLLVSNNYNPFSQIISYFYFKYILANYFRKVSKLERENQREKASNEGEKHQSYPHVYIVRFNAWEYSAAKVIWPGLVRKIMNELERKLFQGFIGQLALIRFKFWRNLQLQLEDNKGTLIVIWVILAGLLAFALWKYKIDSKLFWGALVTLGATGLFKLVVDTLTKPLSQWFVNLIQGSNYGKHIDYMEEIHSDLGLLAKRLEKDNSRILVIIDDLDRCEPQKAVEVLQAVHLLLNFKSFIVCLGIDARIITRAVEQYYKNLLGPAKASGYEYLDKIVQIPFRIPESTPTEIKSFICDLLGNPLPPISTVSLSSDSSLTEESVTNQPTNPENITPSISTSSNLQDKPIIDDPSDPPALVAFSYEELEIFYQYAKFLRPNPRHLKRLVNVYRLVRTLAEYKEETFILDNPDITIHWLVICGQWPYTAYAMLYYFNEMLERLEEEKGNVNPLEYLETNFQISPLKYLHQRVVLQFESNQDAKNKQKKLDHDLDLLRMLLNKDSQLTWTKLNTLSRYTVNFNPAVESVIKAEVPVEVSADDLKLDF